MAGRVNAYRQISRRALPVFRRGGLMLVIGAGYFPSRRATADKRRKDGL